MYFILFGNVRDLFSDEKDWQDFATIADYQHQHYNEDPIDCFRYLDYFCKTLKQNGYKLTGGIYGMSAYVHADKEGIRGSVDYPVEIGSGTGNLSSPPSAVSVRMTLGDSERYETTEPWVYELGFRINLNDPEWFEEMEAGFKGHKPEKYLVPGELERREELRRAAAEGGTTP
jgi:hypothetical protein